MKFAALSVKGGGEADFFALRSIGKMPTHSGNLLFIQCVYSVDWRRPNHMMEGNLFPDLMLIKSEGLRAI